jgi:DNA-binding beta-propeller fold protein YncE/Tol biopolymer transport system component
MVSSSDSRCSGDARGLAGGSLPQHALYAFADLCRRVPCRSVAALCVVGAGLLLWSAPALALSQRGHVFGFSFGAEGKGAGEFLHPSGIAVNNSTGDVYVADRANNRVEEFKPELNSKGELIGEEPLTEFTVPYPESVAVDNSTEVSDPSKGDVYVVGTTTAEAKEEKPEDKLVYKFGSEGEPITKLSKFKTKVKGSVAEEFGAILGVAADSSGALFVYQENGEIDRFNNAEKVNEGESSVRSALTEEPKPGFALDSKDNFYVGVLANIAEVGENEFLLEQIENEYSEQTGEELAVVAKLEGATGKVLDPALDYEYTAAVAVNPAEEVAGSDVDELNDVYLDNVAIVAGEKVTTVAAFSPGGKLIQRFGAPGLKDGDAIAVDSETGAVYVADAKADKVDVFELEPRGRPTVGSLSACTLGGSPEGGCPTVPDVTKLSAQVDPTGAETHYDFEYGAGSCAAVPSGCTTTPETPVGEGFGDQGASVELPGLPAGLYHYRVVASNEFGTVRSVEETFTVLASASGLPDGRAWEMVSPPDKDGAEPEAITEVGGLIQASEDGDAISYVTTGPMPAEAEPEGSRNPEFTQILSTRGSKGWGSQDISTANSRGSGIHVGSPAEYQWFSPNLALALVEPFPGAAHSGSLAGPPLSPPLSPAEEGHQEKTIYLRDDAPLQPEAAEAASYEAAKHNGELMKPPNPGYLALVTKANAPGGEAFGGGIDAGTGGGEYEGVEFSGATPDLSHAVFRSYRAAPGLYEWGPEGDVQLVSVLCPAAKPHCVASEGTRVQANMGGFRGHDVRHAISNDGTRVFWTYSINGAEQLYVRDTETQETLQLDTVQPGASGAGPVHASFDTASADGSKVFFTDPQQLTPGSKARAAEPDLYVAELSGGGAPGSPLSYTLTDLTPEGTNGESADVLTEETERVGVPGASEDGSYVYFVANGALAPGATRGYCNEGQGEPRPAGTTCNLYVRHYNGTEWTPTKLVAALSNEDQPDWGGAGEEGNLGWMTSRVSPNGEYVAFMSDRSLTGYDNEDVSSEAPGERLDEEVYLYDAQTERLLCASCNPSGARPAGVHDLGGEAGGVEGAGLVVDRLQIWAPAANATNDHWLAGSVPGWTSLDVYRADYQSRYLSDSGRLFFNSPDHLVPAATSGKESVYEYEPTGVGSCHGEAGCVGLISSGTSEHESAFLDASASGNDVFFLTASQLVPQDVDGFFDVYDARVCEPSSPCLTAPSGGSEEQCEETLELPVGCKGPPPPSPAFTAPASGTFSGSGNVVQQGAVLPSKTAKPKPLTRAQQLAKALKACKRDKKKSKRVACEKQARKKYGPKKPTKAKKSSRKASRR